MAWTRRLPSGKHQGQYRGVDGRVRTAPGGPWAHKAAAMRAAAAAEHDARALGWRDPQAARRTWGEWCEQWWPTRAVEPSTRARDEGRRDRHLTPRWDGVPLVDITRHAVRAWAADLRAGGLSAASVQRCVHLLSASLNAAVDAEVLAANPAARLRLPTPPPSVERYLTHEELDAVVDELDGAARAMTLLLAGTGMRWGEAAGLHWGRVHSERGFIEVAEVWSAAEGVMKAYPKGRRARQVPIPGWLELGEPRTGACTAGPGHERCRGPLVLASEAGTVLDLANYRRAWSAACRRAQVGHVRVHDLRHTYASWLLQAGVPLAEVGRLLGHQSPLTTQRYAHLAEVPSAAVLAALGTRGRAADVQQSATPQDTTGHHRASLRVVRSDA